MKFGVSKHLVKKMTIVALMVGMTAALIPMPGQKVMAANSVSTLEELLSELDGGAENIQIDDSIIIDDGKSYEIDFTGHNLYFTDYCSLVIANTSVTLKAEDDAVLNGNIKMKSYGSGSGTLNIESGNYQGYIFSLDGEVNIYGGSFENEYDVLNFESGLLNIEGGTFVSRKGVAVYVNSACPIKIKGGTFETKAYDVEKATSSIVYAVGVAVGALEKDSFDDKISLSDKIIDSGSHIDQGEFIRVDDAWSEGYFFCLNVPKATVEKHKEKTIKATPATTSANGKTEGKKCSVCGKIIKEQKTIYKASKISLSKTEYVFNNKTQTPDMVVKDSKGNMISSEYYNITKDSGRKNVGSYQYTLKFKGNYSGTVKKSFVINPKGTTIKKLTPAKQSFTVDYVKQGDKMANKYITGYEIRYSTKSDMADAESVKVTDYKQTSKTIKNLKSNKKYYVQICTYMTVDGKKYKSAWSETKSVTSR